MNEKGKRTNKLEEKEKEKSRGDSGKRKTEEIVEKRANVDNRCITKRMTRLM
jgi:hypothetical protein